MEILNIILNILTSGLPCCLLALGIFLTYRLLDFADLTAEGSFLVGASITATCIYQGINPFVATILGMLGGMLCGALTGFLNRILGIPKLISGIITMTATTTIAIVIMSTISPFGAAQTQVPLSISQTSDSQTIYSLFYPWNQFNRLVEALIMCAVVIVAIVGIYLFFGTEYGMAIRATGLNEQMAKAQGINTTVATIVCISLANGLIGLGGALYVQDTLSVSTISATGYLVIGLASILIGEAIFGKKTFKNWLISVALGSIIYFVIITIAQELGLESHYLNLLYAILITVALCLPAIKTGFAKLFGIYKKKAEVR